uniref:P2X purinoreceptor 7 intracellular domain-containing protein n=1 Tax=Parascaris univalens TaxID=6257 RepID=A0A915AKC4_PARUN
MEWWHSLKSALRDGVCAYRAKREADSKAREMEQTVHCDRAIVSSRHFFGDFSCRRTMIRFVSGKKSVSESTSSQQELHS